MATSPIDAWSPVGSPLHPIKTKEVILLLSSVDGGRSLQDENRSAHVFALPVGGAVEGDLGALIGAAVGRVLVGW